MIRPQFPYPTPGNCTDEDFVYVFNSNTSPILGTAIASGGEVRDIPLLLDPDAPFLWRGLALEASLLWVRFKDCAGNDLSAGYIPIDNYACPASGIMNAGTSGNNILQGLPVPLEADAGEGQGAIFCPAGGIVQVFFYNATAVSQTPPSIQLAGVKRFPKNVKRKC